MQSNITLGIKIDVDTERGTRIGVPQLVNLFAELNIPATFLFSLGPDRTGQAIKKILNPGFFKKVSRTSIVSTYGIRTLLNGTLLPGPYIAKKHSKIMQSTRDKGFEVGIHCYNHIKWQDGVTKMPQPKIYTEFNKAVNEFKHVFGEMPKTAGAPGWQANAKTLAVYDQFDLKYASDCRGTSPFYPKINQQTFKTLQLPTTLPTIDELIGRTEYPLYKLTSHYLKLLKPNQLNILTSHAELEGMKYLDWFRDFLVTLKQHKIQFKTLANIASDAIATKNTTIAELTQGSIEGRSGLMAVQK
jgi:undecaprenyl phosphate-alpha-L-ara4FN deformylase